MARLSLNDPARPDVWVVHSVFRTSAGYILTGEPLTKITLMIRMTSSVKAFGLDASTVCDIARFPLGTGASFNFGTKCTIRAGVKAEINNEIICDT